MESGTRIGLAVGFGYLLGCGRKLRTPSSWPPPWRPVGPAAVPVGCCGRAGNCSSRPPALLGLYEIDIDVDGELLGYRRVRRYQRGKGEVG
ncbi:gas vesicle protein [Micromonospora sp. NBC_01655]|uniref:gas vesicle protein GvpO n=1 Tax=Micromonospora sp. NBC_01655 TaxID=2975983 RepID=UPI00225BAE70|nr:gas vesicle protein GvpO [Micromonospora sp. NBC_01655]MCX4469735.1 gas vesicle protein [Micromonospora sp. NBC_01655]